VRFCFRLKPRFAFGWFFLTSLETAHKLVEETNMSELVVLKVVNETLNGKDYFISLSGTRLKSAFGNSLSSLVMQPFPVRAERYYPTLKLKIPKEMWRLCDWLYKNGMQCSEIFIRNGKTPQLEELRDRLDTGVDFPAEVDPYSIAETLLTFLNSLRDPLIPFESYSSALNVCNNFTLCKQLILKFPEVNYNVFYYLTVFLREFLEHSSANNLTPEKLCMY
jgi:phosphatidylinositol-bisphosphatase